LKGDLNVELKPYESKVLLRSVSKLGIVLTTAILKFPRFALAELNTHRMLSRNSASSRAIPVAKRVAEVLLEPVVPEAFAANIRGMQAGAEFNEEQNAEARKIWIEASRSAAEFATRLEALNVHKQWANRIIEPYAWQTVLVTATDWDNLFNLRISKNAQPEIMIAIENLKAAIEAVPIQTLEYGEWHTPFIDDEDRELDHDQRVLVSVARCARVSTLTHDGRRDYAADLRLAKSLKSNGHMSPFEHVATPLGIDIYKGNFRGWLQYRKMLPNEAVYQGE
jgi:hypothetical protein